MKKHIFFLLTMAAALSLNAQQSLFFHNRTEYLTYQMEQPNRFLPLSLFERNDARNYTQKLDSVVGSDNFDWTRWKNVYAYQDSIVEEISYNWENNAWIPSVKTETDNEMNQVRSYRWTGEGWEHYMTMTYQYLICGENSLLESVTTEQLDSVWVGANRSTYEYDDLCNLTLYTRYSGQNNQGEWIESSKTSYSYNDDGLLDTCVYSTIRNGNWRESEQDIFTYDENNQCIDFLVRTKGGWGPFANNWMDSYRYVFEYQDGELVSELYYVSGFGWFGGGGEMSLDSKSEYFFDANGNEERKTASVFNEADWVVRDSYVNTFDLTVDAGSVLGLAPVWESTLGTGMGFVLGGTMPLNNKWLSCSIVSSNLDTEFKLYCSGFTSVEEHHENGLQVYSEEGRLVVGNTEPVDVIVYDLLGRVVASQKNVTHSEFQLNAGLYVVGNGTSFVKAVVR